MRTFFGLLLICLMNHQASSQCRADNYLSNSIVRIIVKEGAHQTSATGFVWQNSKQVVTALHAMRPNGQIWVEYRGRKIPASIVRKLSKADLVLLNANVSGATPLQRINSNVPTNSNLCTIGYHTTASAAISRNFTKGYATDERLRYLLPSNAISKWSGIPDLNLQVYYIDGSLLPGNSGAPVINENGELIGIGDGGLEGGGMQVSWVIPASHLNELNTSNESLLATSSGNISELFSTEVNLPAFSRPIEYRSRRKNYSFVKTKTRGINDIIQTSDDSEGIRHLLSMNRNILQQMPEMRFDFYEDLNQGITIAVPEGTQPIVETHPNDASTNWLKVRINDNAGVFLSDMQYWETEFEISTADFSQIQAGDSRYFNEVISTHLEDINEPGYSIGQLDMSSLRIIDFGGNNKILKAGYVMFPEGREYPFMYDYISQAVKGNIAFRASLRLGGYRDFDSCKRGTGCRDPQGAYMQLAAMVGIHLTSFANMVRPGGRKVIETNYIYDSSNDDPNTIRYRYYFGEKFFYNSRGRQWKEYGPGPSLTGGQGIFNYREYAKDNQYVYLSFNQTHVKLPIWGGQFFMSRDGGRTWQSGGSTTKRR